MKRIIKYLTVFLVSFMIVTGVKAETINSIDMDIYIDANGDAHVTETWNAYPTEKTEYYHAYHNIGNSKIIDFKVKDESRDYTYTNWDINASFNEKAYKYGYNYTSEGVELCFGKSSYQNHAYTMTYTITSFVSRVSDADIVYWNLFDDISPAPGNVNIVIYADTPFSDTLDVWGYGNYGGLAYVNNGKIYLSSDGVLDTEEYMVALVKFPLNTFNTTNVLDNDFDYYLNMAENGAKHYKDKTSILDIILPIFFTLFPFAIIIFCIIAASKNVTNGGSYKLDFGKEGKNLPKDVNMFRDIPCNKDIFRAYWVANNYNLMKKQTDFLGALLLKWQKEKRIQVQNSVQGTLIKKENVSIILETPSDFSDCALENKLYQYMYEASKDGVLISKEFEKWCKNNYSKMLKWFDDVLDYESDKLALEGKLTKTKEKSLFSNATYAVDASMKEEALQMKGLKKYFTEFKNIQDKKAIDVILWEEYLIYAQIFGVAEEVAREFRRLYPEVITDYSYDSVVFIHTFSYSAVSSATSARSAAMSYSSGGGGFSSGGGGGGSFGGGGGGSR